MKAAIKGSKRASSSRAKVDPRRPLDGKAAADTVGFIVEAASRVLVQHGWDAFSTNKVAKAAGVSVGSVYHYFPSREAIARALVHRIWEDELQAIGTHMSALEKPTLEEMAIAYVSHITKNAKLHAEYSTHLVQLASIDARAWDERIIDLATTAFEAEFGKHERMRRVCEVLYVSVVHVARRAALVTPELLENGTIARELVALVRGYLTEFRARHDVIP